MAIGKPRGNKRTTGGSCSSVTTAVLVTVCVLGVWILTSNYITSSSKTTIPINTSYDVSSFFKSNLKVPMDDATQDKHVDLLTNTSVYEENHGDLGIDVAPHDDELKTRDDQETGQSYKLDDDRDWLAETETDQPKQESADNVDDDAESLNDSDVGKQEAEEQQEEAKEEQEIEISTSIIEDNIGGSKETTSTKKQHKQKTQKMEATDDQETDKQIEPGNEDDIRDLEDTQEQEITNQEHKKGTEQEQEQEQNEDDGPIESHSIAAETKTHVENQEAQEVRTKMEQAKIEPIRANPTIPIKALDSGNSTGKKGDDNIDSYKWWLCNVTDGADYIPCLDNKARRQCPKNPPMCLVPLPKDYKTPIPWPQSRDKIWLHNMPNKALTDFKGNQNWMKVTGEFITFIKAAIHYINFLQQAVPEIAWGKRTRLVLDIGCGVANFGGYLFDKDVLTMSFASKDDQESQIQFALERGIPAISAVMGIQRLPFPSSAFDFVHCARCKVPWHKDGGILLLEVNRLLRPGGYFVWSAAPVYGTLEQDVQIWKGMITDSSGISPQQNETNANQMSALTVALCWELVTIKKDKANAMGVAVYHKPDSYECHDATNKPLPPMCKPDDDPNFAWYVPLQTCMHMVPKGETERGSHWPEEWPVRVQKPPYWLSKPGPNEFIQDYEHWKRVITKTYMSNLGINWSNVRNVMDMRAVYGGFAAALKDLKLWVLNVVNVDSPDTLPLIFERGLVGIYHDWCESFDTYPRTYDLLHADLLFSKLKTRCGTKGVMAEIDRILRPGGWLIARDEPNMITNMEKLLRSLDWEVNLIFVNKQEGLISSRKSLWRPNTYVTP